MQNVAKKILEIWTILSKILTTDKIAAKGGSYSVVNQARVVEELRPLLVERGLIIFPSKVTHLETHPIVTKKDTWESKSFHTTAGIEFTIFDTESGESIVFSGIGSGEDASDKDAGKAFTYAEKKALMKLFFLQQTDDPDQIGSEANLEARIKAAQADAKQASPAPSMMPADAGTIMALLLDPSGVNKIKGMKSALEYAAANGKINGDDMAGWLRTLDNVQKMPEPARSKALHSCNETMIGNMNRWTS